jgi:hypothetical protein
MTKFLLLTFLLISILIIIPSNISFVIKSNTRNECYNKAKKSHRSTTINLINKSGTKIFYTTSKLSEGIWTTGCDPSATQVVLEDGQSVTFANQSKRFLGGVEGLVVYSIGKKAPPSTLSISWKNPLIGKNSYNVSSSNPKYAFTANIVDNKDSAFYVFTIYGLL